MWCPALSPVVETFLRRPALVSPHKEHSARMRSCCQTNITGAFRRCSLRPPPWAPAAWPFSRPVAPVTVLSARTDLSGVW